MAETIARARGRIMPYIAGKTFRINAAYFLAALLLSCGGSAGTITPFGLSFVAASWGGRRKSHCFAFAGTVIGTLLSGFWSSLCATCIFFAAGTIYERFRDKLTICPKFIILSASMVAVMPLFSFADARTAALAIANMAVTIGCTAALMYANRAFSLMLRSKPLDIVEKAAMYGLLLMFSMSFGSMDVFGVRIGAVFAAFAVMCLCSRSLASGCIGAIAIGAGRVLGGDGLALVGALAFCALCASLLGTINKYALAAGFCALAAAAYAYTSNASVISLIEAVLGAIAFVFVPDKILRRSMENVLPSEDPLTGMRTRLIRTADVITRLSDIYGAHEGVTCDGDSLCFTKRQLNGISQALRRTAAAETPKRRCFSIQIGMAGHPKNERDENGDTMLVREYGADTALIISDGMGFGKRAREESACAALLLAELLEIGFDLDEALECLNRLLMAGGNGEMFATLDALIFDGSSASAKFIKFGAPPSYVIRSGRVHTLYAETLPAGIIEAASPAVRSVTLRRGDTVVLMSDGVADALGAEVMSMLIDKVCTSNTSEDAADSLVDAALERGCGTDDMSVIVARIV